MTSVRFAVYRAALGAKLRRLVRGDADPYAPLPAGVSLNPSTGIAAALQAAPRRLAFETTGTGGLGDWQRTARAKLAELAGYEGAEAPPPLTRMLPEEPVGDGVYKLSLYLRVRPETDLPVHLLYTKPLADRPGVFLHLAGSTSGVHLAWGGVRVPIDHQRLAIGADMARQAARRGYLGVAIEQMGYGERGERRLPKRSTNRTIDAANHLLLLGRTLMGEGARDISSALDFLLGPDTPIPVDPARLFLFGHSAGGTLAQFAAALDPRPSGVLASGSVGMLRETIGARGAGGGDGIVPGLLTWLDTPDLLALVAPRRFVGLSGTADHIFPFAGVERAVSAARPAYAELGAGENIQAVPVEGPHRYYAEASWAAWERWIDPPAS